MDISFNPSQISRSLSRFLHRYHLLVFMVIVIGGLSFATYKLYSTTAVTAEPSAQSSLSSFDQKTIDKINNLRGADEGSSPLTLPPGRTNPFQ